MSLSFQTRINISCLASISILLLLVVAGCGKTSNQAPDKLPTSSEDAKKGGASTDSTLTPTTADSGAETSLAEIATNSKPTTSNALSGPVPSGVQPTPAEAAQLRQKNWIAVADLPRQTWDVMYLGSSKIGSMHTHITADEGGKSDQVRATLESVLRVNRGGQPTTQKISITTREKLNGELIDFLATIYEGDAKTEVTATQFDGQLVIQSKQANGQGSTHKIPWQPEYRGPFALEQTLKQQPLKNGELREINFVSVPLFRLVTLKLKGGDKQRVTMLDGSLQELQEINTSLWLEGKPIMETVAWVDDQGETLKSAALGLQVLTYRGTQALAEAVNTAAQVDLLKVTSVPLPAGTPNLHQTPGQIYKIKSQRDLYKIFSNKTNQTVRSTLALECDVTVMAIRPDQPIPQGINTDDLPSDLDRNPSPLIQSADPAIVDMAKQCAADETDTAKLAIALEKFVHDKIERKDFSRSFASAADVARQPRGDCTEHAVLLAALLRARGIPARVASGLVYVDTPSGPMMGYHMWNEAYIGDRWYPLDAVLGLGGIGAGHLKILESSLPDENPYVALLPVLQALGELQVSSVTPVP